LQNLPRDSSTFTLHRDSNVDCRHEISKCQIAQSKTRILLVSATQSYICGHDGINNIFLRKAADQSFDHNGRIDSLYMITRHLNLRRTICDVTRHAPVHSLKIGSADFIRIDDYKFADPSPRKHLDCR
jgi:hypothetical protein